MDFCDGCGHINERNQLCSNCDLSCSLEKTKLCTADEKIDDKNNGEDKQDVAQEIKDKWEREQIELKQKQVLEDNDVIKKIRSTISCYSGTDGDNTDVPEYYIGGVDISFVKGDDINACAALVVVNFPKLEVVYEDYRMIKLTAPYIPGFLAFREAHFLVELYETLKTKSPEYLPQVIFVDGNGLLHPKEFGLACHLGVLLDVPCVGVAKKLFQVDGLEKDANHQEKIKQLKQGGDTFPLRGSSGKVLGMSLRSCDSTSNPIYVSVGHKISLESAVWLVYKCCKYRIPEPVRQADINSREYLRVNFKHDDNS